MIGRTNAVIGGTTKTDYELWQEGFGANWDSVVANAPMTNTQRILHIYTKVELLKMFSNFITATEIYTYNGSVYRQIIMDTNKRLAFISADYITNTFDNLQYVCVVYGYANWGAAAFQTWLPVVYGNSKSVNLGFADVHVNLLRTATGNYYPTLRGVDVNTLSIINLAGGLEHITYQNISQPLAFRYDGLRNCEIRILKSLCDTLPSGLSYYTSNNFSEVNVKITDEALADWFYNTWLYAIYATGTRFNYPYGLYYVRRFKVNSAMPLKASATYASYIARIPNCDYIEGTFTEDQTSAFPGLHGFNSNYMSNLKNFPMWTVIGGATTGCLLPATSENALANFRFYSLQLERSNFALFNDGVIDLDPTKSFVANLPYLSGTVAQTITFDDTTFKNQFTAEERTQIEDLVVNQKKWGLSW